MINLKDKIVDTAYDKIYDAVYSQIAPDLGLEDNMTDDKEMAEIIGFLLTEIDKLEDKLVAQSTNIEARLKKIEADSIGLNLLQKNSDTRVDYIEENLGTIVDTLMSHTTRLNKIDNGKS